MGIYKKRTAFINKSMNETTDAEAKKLLANGLIPDSLKAEYEAFVLETGEDADIDKISNANYFAINPEKVAGKIIAGSGFLNPTITKGTIEGATDTISSTLSKTPAQEDIKPISETIKPKGEPTKPIPKMETLDEAVKKKFKHLSNQQLVDRANNAPDFGWDDEEVELNRRRKESNGKFDIKMQGNTNVILNNEEV